MDPTSSALILVTAAALGIGMCFIVARAFPSRPAKVVRIVLAGLIGAAVGGIVGITIGMLINGPEAVFTSHTQVAMYLVALGAPTALGAVVAILAVVRSNKSLERTRDR
jgi:fructose-specific phosphotransferase system IIC component